MTVLKSHRTRFNTNTVHPYGSFLGLEQDLDILSSSLSQRIEYCFNYYNLLEKNDLRSLSDDKDEHGRDQNVDLGDLTIRIDGHNACALAINTAVDGFYFNISSSLDIFAKIAIVLIYPKPPKKRFYNLNTLSDFCENKANAPSTLEQLVMSNFVRNRSKNTRSSDLINDLRNFRNTITHELTFLNNRGTVKWDKVGRQGPVKPYLKVNPNLFPNIPLQTDDRFVDYTQYILLKVDDFLKAAIDEVTILVGKAQHFPIY